jgi:uroporphyrinogen-III synthase
VTAPLAGLRVVVTRAAPQSGELGRLLREQGAEPVFVPVIAIADPESWDELDRGLERLAAGGYAWVVFTSVNAVTKVFERAGGRIALGGARVGAVGRATASALDARGTAPDLVPGSFTARALVDELGRGPGAVLVPRVAGAPPETIAALRAAGWMPDEVSAYRNLPARSSPATGDVRAGSFDILTLTSASSARNFCLAVATPHELGLDPEGGAKLVACIGPRTAAAAAEVGFRVDVAAAEHTARGLVDALCAHVGARRMAP